MILLFGSTGYIGSEFKTQLNLKEIPFICGPSAKSIKIEDLCSIYNENKIKTIINAAGYTGKPNVDSCEFNKEETLYGNVEWPKMLTDFCMRYQIQLLHVSSGCIYEGTNNYEGFDEDDEPNLRFDLNNCSFYSGSKVLGEKEVSLYEKSWICRLRIPFEKYNNPRNYISKVLNYSKLLDAENSMSNKQEFVKCCIEMIIKNINYGIYNITNTGYITTREVTELLNKHKITNKTFDFFLNEEDFYKSGVAVARRSNCILNNTKLINSGIYISDIYESIEKSILEFK